jgi:Domain of unknown function (DUF397)
VAVGSERDDEYRISSFSGSGSCVAVTQTTEGVIIVKHSQRPEPHVMFTSKEWWAFVAGVKNGEFDFPIITESA